VSSPIELVENAIPQPRIQCQMIWTAPGMKSIFAIETQKFSLYVICFTVRGATFPEFPKVM